MTCAPIKLLCLSSKRALLPMVKPMLGVCKLSFCFATSANKEHKKGRWECKATEAKTKNLQVPICFPMNFPWACWPLALSITPAVRLHLGSGSSVQLNLACCFSGICRTNLITPLAAGWSPFSGDSVSGPWGPSSKLPNCNNPILSFCFLNPNGSCFLQLPPPWLGQELANYSLRAEPCLLPLFVNKGLLGHTQAQPLHLKLLLSCFNHSLK